MLDNEKIERGLVASGSRCTEARRLYEDAARERDAWIRTAVSVGELSIVRIAQLAQVSRPTVYAVVRRD